MDADDDGVRGHLPNNYIEDAKKCVYTLQMYGRWDAGWKTYGIELTGGEKMNQ